MALNFPTPTTVGEIHEENGTKWQWNGASWTRVVAAGSQGFQGTAGSQGAVGAQGNAGAQGDTGLTGAQGAAGAQGQIGNTGAQGAAGAQGSPGAQGDTGLTGAQGAAGAQGASGAQGTNGIIGSNGAQGATGAQGAQGTSFSRSESNATATSGQTTFAVSGGYTNGDDLDVFLNGIRLTPDEYTATNGTDVVLDVGATAGDIVDILYFESAGPQGAQGDTGLTGAQGAAGAQGTAGAQGAAGAQGSVGAQGSQGAQGYQGAGGSATITNEADNRVLTATGTAGTINGEANLTFNGTTFAVSSVATINYTGTATPYNNNSSTLLGPHNISLIGQWSTVNWPSDHSTADTTEPWYMMGRPHGTTDRWSFATRPGGANNIYNIIDCYNNADGTLESIRFGTNNGTERLRIDESGAFGLSGANYGTSGQVLTSQGSGSAPQWASVNQIYRINETSLSGTTGATLTGIDSDALWISVVFSSISTTANSAAVIQLTNSAGTPTTSGYDSRGSYLNTGTGTYNSSSGFCLHNADASLTIKGYWSLFRQASGIWVGGGSGKSGASTYVWAGNMGGGPTIGGIRISVPSGTFDDGSFAVFWGA